MRSFTSPVTCNAADCGFLTFPVSSFAKPKSIIRWRASFCDEDVGRLDVPCGLFPRMGTSRRRNLDSQAHQLRLPRAPSDAVRIAAIQKLHAMKAWPSLPMSINRANVRMNSRLMPPAPHV